MAGHSIQTGVTDNDSNNGNNKRVDSLRSNGSIPTSELGKSFAARNINMATLAIQLTAQTSLVPELASGQFHHNRNYKWQQRPFSSTSLPLRPRNDTDNTSTADTSTVDNDESRSRLSSSRKTVTFNSEIDEIQIFDPSTTPESDSQIMDEPDELFAAGEDSDLSPDDDSAINIEIAKDNDGEDDENTNNDEQVSVDDGKQASACTMDGGSSSSSTVPTMVERDLRDEKSLLDARKAVQNRKGRISRDESFQSVESQLMEAILKVKASNQYRAAAPAKTQSMPSLVSHNEKELGLATKMSFASYGDTPTQEPILLGYPSTPIDTTKNQDGDFGKSILNEFDKITSKQC
ncbi:hypothetical protein BJV82DRAFT_61252 [Fennellomyces sp. T-0311]|nr:hypothetical protein BJV82DRAFT_61252 [Fennellomyces sp. T-0311]